MDAHHCGHTHWPATGLRREGALTGLEAGNLTFY